MSRATVWHITICIIWWYWIKIKLSHVDWNTLTWISIRGEDLRTSPCGKQWLNVKKFQINYSILNSIEQIFAHLCTSHIVPYSVTWTNSTPPPHTHTHRHTRHKLYLCDIQVYIVPTNIYNVQICVTFSFGHPKYNFLAEAAAAAIILRVSSSSSSAAAASAAATAAAAVVEVNYFKLYINILT